MHYSKTYDQLLLTLPPELRDNAIEYRKVKVPTTSVTEGRVTDLSPAQETYP